MFFDLRYLVALLVEGKIFEGTIFGFRRQQQLMGADFQPWSRNLRTKWIIQYTELRVRA
jgi:hypothetical protein